jgi:hypothetical protein
MLLERRRVASNHLRGVPRPRWSIVSDDGTCGWQVHVFDDADPELQHAGLVGTAEVALKELIEAGRVQAEVAVKDRAGKVSQATGGGAGGRDSPAPYSHRCLHPLEEGLLQAPC